MSAMCIATGDRVWLYDNNADQGALHIRFSLALHWFSFCKRCGAEIVGNPHSMYEYWPREVRIRLQATLIGFARQVLNS